MSILVAYFSATGNTRKRAQKLADELNADIFEIKPLVPYSKHDLNWLNPNSRSSLEMKDPKSRPETEDDSIDISRYDIIYLGFPIWWYVAPHIVNTFLETHDFSGKDIVLFATSGGSGFGKTVEGLKSSVDNTCTISEGTVNGRKE